MGDVLARVQALKFTPSVHACQPQLLRDLEAVHSFLSSLAEFSRPALPNASCLSPFLKQVLRRSDFFVTMVVAEDCNPAIFNKAKTVRGRAALELMFHDFTSPNPHTEEYAKWLQAYAWMRSHTHKEAVESILNDFARDHRAALVAPKCLADAVVGVGSGASASYSSHSALVATSKGSSILSAASASKDMSSSSEAASQKEARAQLLNVLRGKSKKVT